MPAKRTNSPSISQKSDKPYNKKEKAPKDKTAAPKLSHSTPPNWQTHYSEWSSDLPEGGNARRCIEKWCLLSPYDHSITEEQWELYYEERLALDEINTYGGEASDPVQPDGLRPPLRVLEESAADAAAVIYGSVLAQDSKIAIARALRGSLYITEAEGEEGCFTVNTRLYSPFGIGTSIDLAYSYSFDYRESDFFGLLVARSNKVGDLDAENPRKCKALKEDGSAQAGSVEVFAWNGGNVVGAATAAELGSFEPTLFGSIAASTCCRYDDEYQELKAGIVTASSKKLKFFEGETTGNELDKAETALYKKLRKQMLGGDALDVDGSEDEDDHPGCVPNRLLLLARQNGTRPYSKSKNSNLNMSDPSTFNGPLHPDVAPYLDAEYAAFHNKYLIDRPAIHKIPWDPACRAGTNPSELEPCQVGSVRDLTIPGTPPVNVRVFTPSGGRPVDGWPVLVFYHGGGWMLGGIGAENSFCTRTCLTAKCVVVAVDYRLAPEHVFPAAVDDSWTALKWIYEHGATELDIDLSRIAVGGSSAGGNLSAVMTQRAVQRSPPLPIRYQVLIVPVTDNTTQEDGSSLLPTHHESWVKWKNTTPLIPKEMLWFRNHYLPDESKWTHMDASPLLQRDDRVWSQLPDAWIGVAELDILRSEGEAYAQKLKKAGKNVELVVYPGAPHSIIVFDKAVKVAFQLGEDAAQALYKAFYAS
ncbi:hypothetical protein FRC11_005279 [Ceratobasidium sp. 423]|nr:hypothetical protein FRC11_005279 [Ceratobasidium sp. 423]